jgi:hypothetical protein
MGLYEGTLQCGCVQVTSTLEIPPVTFTVKYCKTHLPKEKDGKKEDNQKDPNK